SYRRAVGTAARLQPLHFECDLHIAGQILHQQLPASSSLFWRPKEQVMHHLLISWPIPKDNDVLGPGLSEKEGTVSQEQERKYFCRSLFPLPSAQSPPDERKHPVLRKPVLPVVYHGEDVRGMRLHLPCKALTSEEIRVG